MGFAVCTINLNLVMDSVSRKAPALLCERRQSMAFFVYGGGEMLWEDYVEKISHGWAWPEYTPEKVMETYHHTNKRLANVRERLKNPVSLKGGGPLQPSTIRQLENEEKNLIKEVYNYRKFIKCLVKYNLLPTSKLISGKDRKQFVFSLWTMLELPELGKAIYYANQLMGSRYGHGSTPATNQDYAVRQSLHEGYLPRKHEERSRESMYDALVDSLNATLERLKKERQRLLFSGEPWKPQKNNSDDMQEATIADLKRRIADAEARLPAHGIKKPCILSLITQKGLVPVVSAGQVPETIKDGLSDEFRSFLKKDRSGTEHHENA